MLYPTVSSDASFQPVLMTTTSEAPNSELSLSATDARIGLVVTQPPVPPDSMLNAWLEDDIPLASLTLPQEFHDDGWVGDRYEVLDGAMLSVPYPGWTHQEITGRLFYILDMWTRSNRQGRVATTPCLYLANGDRIMPDVAWVSEHRFRRQMDARGHLRGVPELVVEVLSREMEDGRCDRQLKLKIYSREGVKEYWIVDPTQRQIQVYCREQAVLALAATYQQDEVLESRLLPNCLCSLDTLFG